MRTLLLLLTVLPFGSAQAQDRVYNPRSQALAAAIDQGRFTNLLRSQSPTPDRLECLTRIKDQRTVCHTRAEWQAIARRIEKSDS